MNQRKTIIMRRIGSIIIALMLSLGMTCTAFAQSGKVDVKFPNLADGQTVGGKINLSVQVSAPAAVASVEYLLDDQSLAKVVIAPFSYEWDSTTVAPGTYTLAAKVTDKNGNVGQAQVKLNIARPVEVTFPSSQETVRVGDKVMLRPTVAKLVDISRVELLIDGQSIASDNTPPFEFSFDSSSYSVGKHTVTIRAEDILGRKGEASLDLQLAPPEQAGWVKVVIIIGVIATILAAIFALYRTVKWSKRSYQRSGRIELRNLGNVRSRYELRAGDPTGVLKFQMLLNGASLPPLTTVTETAIPSTATAAPSAPATGGSVKQSAGNVMKSGSAIADLLTSIGSLIPGSLGSRLMSTGASMRQAKYTAGRVGNVAGQIKPSTSATPAAAPSPKSTVTTTVIPGAWNTPYLEPGEALALNLVIDPGRPKQAMHYSFRVSSKSIDFDNAAPLIENGSLQIEGVSLFRLYLPFFIIAGVTILVIVIIALLLSNTGVLG